MIVAVCLGLVGSIFGSIGFLSGLEMLGAVWAREFNRTLCLGLLTATMVALTFVVLVVV